MIGATSLHNYLRSGNTYLRSGNTLPRLTRSSECGTAVGVALETVQAGRLDQKATNAFRGLLVRKELLRVLRSSYDVPIFVIEFLLGKYAASPVRNRQAEANSVVEPRDGAD